MQRRPVFFKRGSLLMRGTIAVLYLLLCLFGAKIHLQGSVFLGNLRVECVPGRCLDARISEGLGAGPRLFVGAPLLRVTLAWLHLAG